MKNKELKKEKVISKQNQKLIKREEKFFCKKENEYIKNKMLPIKEKLEEKIPEKMIQTFQKAFEKGFYFVFEKGTVIIEKSYNSEKLKNEADINEYILSKKIDNRNIKKIDRGVKKGIFINKSITTAEGALLGAFGIGLPDIPVFIGVILKTVYEICLHYGFDYDSKDEKVFILNIICASTSKAAERLRYSDEADRIAHSIDNKINIELNINEAIKAASSNLSEKLLISKVIQGVPIIGALGGLVNYKLIRDISEVASVKYKKRLLSKL